jgi:hypothetical protein
MDACHYSVLEPTGFLADPVSELIGASACFLTMYFTVYRKLKKESLE